MRSNVITSGIVGRETKRPMMGARESSRYGFRAAKEYECQLSWILTKRRNTKMLNKQNGIGKHSVIVLSLLTLLFWAGSSWAGQGGKVTQLSTNEVSNLTTGVKTAADHGRLAQTFTAKADAYEAEAQEHEDLATEYRQTPNPDETKHPGSPRTSAHCYQAAAGFRRLAQNARQLANEHTEMGKSASN